MKPRTVAQIALAALGGIFYFLGFVGFGLWPLELVLFVPLLFALQDATPKRALGLGVVFGTVTNLGGYYWVVHLLREFADLSAPLALLGCFLLCLYQGFLLAILAWMVRRAELDLKIAPIWTLAVAFPALELAYPLLFPSYVGNALYQVSVLTQIVDVTGMLGLTVLIALINGGLYELLSSHRQKRPVARRRVYVPAFVAAACAIYGVVRIPMIEAEMASARTMKVAMVQTNLGARDKAERSSEFIERHQRMSHDALDQHPGLELVVWPESAYNRLIRRDTKNLADITDRLNVPVIFGALTYDAGPNSERRLYNTAILVSSFGDVIGMFDKVVLLAFGETIPLSDTFPIIKKWLPRASTFTRGTRFSNFHVNDAAILPMICYEDIIPSFVSKMWSKGGPADVLVNVTNDSWYGNTHEPLIHLALSSFRSIETRRALMRSTNTGISAFVDPVGRIVKRTGQWTQEILVHDVPLIEHEGSTIYMWIGDLIGWIALGFVGWGGVLSWRVRRAAPPPATPKVSKRAGKSKK